MEGPTNHFDLVKNSAQYSFPRQRLVGAHSNGCGSVEGGKWVNLSTQENAELDAREAAWPPLVPKNVSSHGYPNTDIAKLIDHVVELEKEVTRLKQLIERVG